MLFALHLISFSYTLNFLYSLNNYNHNTLLIAVITIAMLAMLLIPLMTSHITFNAYTRNNSIILYKRIKSILQNDFYFWLGRVEKQIFIHDKLSISLLRKGGQDDLSLLKYINDLS